MISDLNEQTQKKYNAAIETIALGISKSFDVDTISQVIVEECVDLSNASRGSLFIFDPASQKLTMIAEINNSPTFRFRAEYKISEKNNFKIGLTAYAFKIQNTVHLNSHEEIRSHHAHLGKYVDDSFDETDCLSIACIPLKNAEKEVIGVLKIENTLDKHGVTKFSEQTILCLQYISEFSAKAITNFLRKDNKIYNSNKKILAEGLKFRESQELYQRLLNILSIFQIDSKASSVSIWIFEGSVLKCISAIGYNSDEMWDYSYDLINSFEKIGLIPYVASSKKNLNIKNYHEINNHSEYNEKLDSIWYGNLQNQCNAFLGEPLKKEDEVIGVIVATKLKKDDNYFKTEENHLLSYMSIVVSNIIKFERTARYQDKLVSLYKLGTDCYKIQSYTEILRYLLVGLTNGQGIGFNRVSLFKVNKHNNLFTIQGIDGLGPLDIGEATIIQREIDNDPNKYDINLCIGPDAERESQLSSFIQKQKICLTEKCDLYEYLQSVISPLSRYPFKKQYISNCCHDIQEFIKKINVREEFFHVFSIINGDDIYIGICDNIYLHSKIFDEFTDDSLEVAVNIFVEVIKLALNRLTLQKSKDKNEEEFLNQLRDSTEGITHRIGTQLSIVEGSIRSIKSKLQQEHIFNLDNYTEDIESLERCNSRLKRYSQQYASLHKLSNNERKNVNIIDTINRVIGRAEEQKKDFESNIAIRKNYSEENIFVSADEEALQEVLDELLLNAIKAIPNDGEIRIHTKKCPENKYLVITVSDTGCGIDPSIRSQIYDPSFKYRNFGTDLSIYNEGTGLGLHLVKKTIERHDGIIMNQANPNGGTIFTVKLPL